jgi:hypothetical protein
MNTFRNLPGKLLVTVMSLDPRLRRRSQAAAGRLRPHEAELFLDMSRYDLAHSLTVAERLKEDPLLYRAALLHDAGKLRGDLGLFTRWLYILLEILAPGSLRRREKELEEMAAGKSELEKARSLPAGWRRGFYVQAHHAEIGAEILSERGSEEELTALIGGHQGEPKNDRARRLAQVDDAY